MQTDWNAWHDAYHDPASPLSQRRRIIQRFIEEALDQFPDPLRILSLCAGDGRDLLEVLAEGGPRRVVRARLIETEAELIARAQAFIDDNQLEGVEAVRADAAQTDTYAGLTPANIVLMAGVLGNVSDEDVRQIVDALPQLCDVEGIVIWTRHRRNPDLTPTIRAWLSDAGFEEVHFESPGANSFSVGMHRLLAQPRPLERGARLFQFVR